MVAQTSLTQILTRMERGEHDAVRELFVLVYAELRHQAAQFLAKERADHTLQATALVHEAFVKIVGGQKVNWTSRQHFYSVAADAMRKILVDHARRKRAAKRGGRLARVDLATIEVAQIDDNVDIMALDAALTKLQKLDPRRYRVVMYRYFSGLTEEQIAALTQCAVKTVQRDWMTARMFLLAEMDAAS